MPGRSPDRERFPLPPPLNKLSAIIGRVCLAAYQRYLLSLSLFFFPPLSFFLSFFIILSSHGGEATLLREKPSKSSGIDSIFRILTFVCRPGIFLFLLRERNYSLGGREREREERKKFVFESRGERLRRKDEGRIFYRPEVDVRREEIGRVLNGIRGPRASRVNYSRGTRCSTTQASLERAKGSTFVIGRVKKRGWEEVFSLTQH